MLTTTSTTPPGKTHAPRPTNQKSPKKAKRPAGSGFPWYTLVFVVLVLFVWWLVTALGLVPEYILPSPGATLQVFIEEPGYIAASTWVTTYETLAGFVIAAVVGVLVAILMVYSPTVEKTLYPIILFFQVVPKIAIAPLFVVWLGFGPAPKILVAVLVAFFPVVISGLGGLRSIDPEILQLTSTMGASRFKTLFKVRLPAALPELLSGLKVAATLAVTGAVVGEFVGANQGLGYVILQANGNLDTALLVAALLVMSLLGVVLFVIIEVAERLLIPWHASQRNRSLPQFGQ
ncbi:ABC transporter permease [Compostimonas suwonensis]|uniref:NitT/TauT family transport system permease protein n=1 Tax=Compostimonas suwonensis TaxID=1048394 RepID=A0A2M9C0A9_9MICO|nr:ABC transporter permease [Compostimonas suwonensis]PJJ63765.1 NitT/TauT family transport system permease protein [Compostimonas suwonensis]